MALQNILFGYTVKRAIIVETKIASVYDVVRPGVCSELVE
jgi:hypothetical protein